MAGFMAGFGKAFSSSFEAARERSARKEDDLFKMQFEAFQKKKAKRDETILEDQKNVRMAKSLVEQYGQDPRSWSKIHEWLRSGQDESSIRKMLESGRLEVGNLTPDKPADPAMAPDTDLTTSASQAVDSQMAGSGMQPPEDKG